MSHHGPEYYLKEAIQEHLLTLHRTGSAMELPPPYVYMPVPFGYGKRTLDFLVGARKLVTDFNGKESRAATATMLGIEAKAPGKKPTKSQETCMREIEEAGGVSFWCDSFSGYLMNMHLLGFTPLPRGKQPEPERVLPRGKSAMIV